MLLKAERRKRNERKTHQDIAENVPEQPQIREYHSQKQRKYLEPHHFQTLIPPANIVCTKWQCYKK